MAYEVVKTIGSRQYRYRVQSERDPASGKTRNRWTYLGRVSGDGEAAKARTPRPNARLRLLDAAERLLAAGDVAAVSVDAIAAEAGVAHGTFYRYFRDRTDALQQLAGHIRTAHGIGDEQLLRDDVESLDAARAGARRWIIEKLRLVRERRAALSAWYSLLAGDARLSAYRDERRVAMQARVSAHITALNAHGFTDVADPAATASILIALVDGILRTALIDRDPLDDARITAAADVVERALFTRLA